MRCSYISCPVLYDQILTWNEVSNKIRFTWWSVRWFIKDLIKPISDFRCMRTPFTWDILNYDTHNKFKGSRTISPRTISPRTISPGQYPPGQYPPVPISPRTISPRTISPRIFFFNSSVLNYPKLCAGKKNSIKKKIAVLWIILKKDFKNSKKKLVF